MSTPNRTALLAKLHKTLRKHYKPHLPPTDRSVLEHLLYACCLENARAEAADEAFARLKELYFDWNEVRVTTVTELAESMSSLPDAVAAGQRIKKSLQSVFETTYTFDLESLRKQNLGKAEKDLEKISGATPFVRAYVLQHALGGHFVPVNQGAREVLYAVGVITDTEIERGEVPGLERAIPKNKGLEFGSLLQQIGADYYTSPGSSKVKSILAEIDPDYKERLTRRATRLEELAKEAAEQERDRAAARRAEVRASQATGKELAGKGDSKAKAKKDATDSKAAKPKEAVRPPPAAEVKRKKDEPAPARKEPAKGLAKKKPR
jgi:endonuclease-3